MLKEHIPLCFRTINDENQYRNCNQQHFAEKQLTIKIYQLSNQLDELLSHRKYKDARIIADELDAALNRFITIKQNETINNNTPP